MSKKANEKGEVSCDEKTASTLAAVGLMQYFKQRDWKVVSFFPNAPCCLGRIKQKK